MPSPVDSSTAPGTVPKAPPSTFPKTLASEEVEKFLLRGDFAGAVRVAFPRVMADVRVVYGLGFPSHWTARDVLAHGLRADMGLLPDLLFQLYSIYEPVRYGLPRDWVQGDIREILRRIYTETGLRSVAGPPAETSSLARPTFSVVARKEPTETSAGGSNW